MLNAKLLAALIAIVMTLLTIYVVPLIYHFYVHWSDSLSHEQQQWFNYSQIVLGALLASFAIWQWKRNRSNKKLG